MNVNREIDYYISFGKEEDNIMVAVIIIYFVEITNEKRLIGFQVLEEISCLH